MNARTSNTLSISLSRNRLGFAVFQGKQLHFYGGKTLRQFASTTDRLNGLERILRKLMDKHGPTTLILPRLNKQQKRSTELCRMNKTIKEFAHVNGIRHAAYNPALARHFICTDQKPTKANTARNLAARHTELQRYIQSDNDWERRYYGHVFTAIAGGHFFVNDRKDYFQAASETQISNERPKK